MQYAQNLPESVETPLSSDNESPSGVITEFSDLDPQAIINEEELAKIFQKHPISIKRAVDRGELPQPTRMFGKNVWTVKVLNEHIESRLKYAAQEAEKESKRLNNISPLSQRNRRS